MSNEIPRVKCHNFTLHFSDMCGFLHDSFGPCVFHNFPVGSRHRFYQIL
jgi:hypothetical protein